MEIKYSVSSNILYDTFVSSIKDGVSINFIRQGVNTSIAITPQTIFAHTKETSFSDNSVYYAVLNTDGSHYFVNGYRESFYKSEDPNVDYGAAIQRNIPVQILIALASDNLRGASIIVNSKEAPFVDGVQLSTENLVDETYLPSFMLGLSSEPTQSSQSISVRLQRNRVNFLMPGVTVYASSSTEGILTSYTAQTNPDGIATFTRPSSKLPGTVSFGFKYTRNLAPTNLI